MICLYSIKEKHTKQESETVFILQKMHEVAVNAHTNPVITDASNLTS